MVQTCGIRHAEYIEELEKNPKGVSELLRRRAEDN
jgi:hypothetical protein